ncbi:DUF6566 family protein [Paraburkholderia phenoliruptrix]|uniref:DUF6566 family protein n=1 Tax=Paraburkholderia phenoliruptrix TaxID=252970 RepID=A0ABV3WEL9_9BURK
MEDAVRQACRKVYYRGYVISSTARTNGSGRWEPRVEVTLRGRPIILSRERPDLTQQSCEDAVRAALAWARHLIDQREVPESDIGDHLLGGADRQGTAGKHVQTGPEI